MRTVLLLIGSNVFMNFAWYGHLKFRGSPLLIVILVSWLIAPDLRTPKPKRPLRRRRQSVRARTIRLWKNSGTN